MQDMKHTQIKRKFKGGEILQWKIENSPKLFADSLER